MTISRLAWCCACAACGAVVLSAAHAQEVLHVNAAAPPGGDGSSWQAAFADLQDALAAAADEPAPVQIWIAAGTYTPGPPEAGPEATFELISGVQMYGGFAGDEQSLDERDWETNETMLSGLLGGDGSVRVWHVLRGDGLDESVILDGLVVRDGYAVDFADFELGGGGLWLVDSSMHIANCTFIDNDSIGDGAAALIDASTVTIASCIFASNVALPAQGGGLKLRNSIVSVQECTFSANYADGGQAIAAWESELSVEQCVFDGHSLGVGWPGGVLYGQDSLISINNSIFSNNHATSANGGISLGSSDITITQTTFTGNSGDGPTILAATASNVVFQDCEIVQNTGTQMGGSGTFLMERTEFIGSPISNHGGGIQWFGDGHIIDSHISGHGGSLGPHTALMWGGEGAELTITNTSISGSGNWNAVAGGVSFAGASLTMINCLLGWNSASSGGGGMRIWEGAEATVINCTFKNNSTASLETEGVALLVEPGAHATILNSIVWDNAIQGGPPIAGNVTIAHSNVQSDEPWPGAGNINEDPLFVDGPGRLAPGSPAIDAGANDFVPDGITTDLDGNPRFVDGTGDGNVVVDMGAFEFQGLLPGDINQDGLVNVDDLLILLAAWGECDDPADCPADLTGDGAVGIDDLLILLTDWTFS